MARLRLAAEPYRAALDQLQTAGLVRLGPGRGGTVRRALAEVQPAPAGPAVDDGEPAQNLPAPRPTGGGTSRSQGRRAEHFEARRHPLIGVPEALAQFAASLRTNFSVAGNNPAHPEDQLKGPIQTLLSQFGVVFGHEVVGRTEAPAPGVSGRPDVGVSVDGLLTGYIELKAPGKGADPNPWQGSDREQWERFRALPNLIYTDSREWALYRHGERQGPQVRLKGSPTTQGARAIGTGDALALEGLFRDFVGWVPVVPASPDALARLLAPLCRYLREQVLEGLQVEGSTLSQLAVEWRQYLFGDADDATFADAYAQTVTYALLLARLEGEGDLRLAAERLDPRHGLLAQVLRLLTQAEARREIEVPVSLIERVVAAVDLARLASAGGEPWLYFYEDFLAIYDERLRKERGVYYTPAPVVACQVNLVADLLDKHFGKALAFADDDVVLLDPACGTGTYPLAAITLGLELTRARFGQGALPGRATTVAANTHAFEILVGPYAVAHLRLAQAILGAGGGLPAGGVGVYLTDTLEAPHAGPATQIHTDVFHRRLAVEAERARAVKAQRRVLVCIGNPPYDRQAIDQDDSATRRKGGWVRFAHETSERPILEDFLEPAREAGAGVHLKNLYNDYVYFWRWALWKVFDSTGGPGIVSFITAASYLTGPGFVGMREVMRRTFDELWIIDLGGEGRGARRSENVFDIQTPVAIAIGVRYKTPAPDDPARVWYTAVTGDREQKFSYLTRVRQLADIPFEPCPTDWHAAFLPAQVGDYASWPRLTDVFPWQHSGVQVKRTWPIAPAWQVLHQRWRQFLSYLPADRPAAFHETRDRKVASECSDQAGARMPTLYSLGPAAPAPRHVRYAYRSLDRQWLLKDPRLADYLRPSLLAAHGPHQIYLTSLLTGVLGTGPAATVAAAIPDMHHFRGSFGAKDVIPIYRDAAATEPNVTGGLLDQLTTEYGEPISVEDLLAYAYAILQSPSYTGRFADHLRLPGPRIPITKDLSRFREGVALGGHLIWLHSYGERWVPAGAAPGRVPQGQARAVISIPPNPERYPHHYSYDPQTEVLHVGEGAMGPVAAEVFGYTVSGFPVVRSWLDYRMAEPRGRRSSPLDNIRQVGWPATFTTELLELLWVLEATVGAGPALDDWLTAVVGGLAFNAEDLPQPSDSQRLPPDPHRSEHLFEEGR